MYRYFTFIVTCVLSLCFIGCYDDYERTNQTIIPEENDTFVDGRVAGIAMDEKAMPLENYTIQLSSSDAYIGERGLFHFNELRLLQEGEGITIISPSGFTYQHTARPRVNDVFNARLHCFTQLVEQDILSNETAEIKMSEAVTLKSANPSFQLNNVAYNEPVRFRGYHLSLDEEQNLKYAPKAKTSETELRWLNDGQMVHIQWDTYSGDRLDLQTQSKFRVSIEMEDTNADLYAWHYNELTWRWDKHQIVALSDGKAEFEVDNDGYWVVAQTKDAVRLSGRVLSKENGAVITNLLVKDSGGRVIDRMRTSNNGSWNFLAPKDQPFSVHILDQCGSTVHTESYSGLGTSQTEISIQLSTTQNFNIAVKSCEDEYIMNSFVLLNDEFVFSPSGKIEFCIVACSSMIELSGLVADRGESSTKINWTAEAINNVQSLFICPDVQGDYILIHVDDKVHFYGESIASESDQSRLVISSKQLVDPDFLLDIIASTNDVGIVVDNKLNIQFNDRNMGVDGYILNCPTSPFGCGFEHFEITHFGSSTGEWITGYFTGEFWMQTTNLMPNVARSRTLEGEFRVKRIF